MLDLLFRILNLKYKIAHIPTMTSFELFRPQSLHSWNVTFLNTEHTLNFHTTAYNEGGRGACGPHGKSRGLFTQGMALRLQAGCKTYLGEHNATRSVREKKGHWSEDLLHCTAVVSKALVGDGPGHS